MPDSGTMPSSDSQEPADLLLQLALPRSQKVVLVIDLVKSVRLMSGDKAGTVARWHGFVQQAQELQPLRARAMPHELTLA